MRKNFKKAINPLCAHFSDKTLTHISIHYHFSTSMAKLNGDAVILMICIWLYRKMSYWQLSMQSVTKISSKWQHFHFIRSTNARIVILSRNLTSLCYPSPYTTFKTFEFIFGLCNLHSSNVCVGVKTMLLSFFWNRLALQCVCLSVLESLRGVAGELIECKPTDYHQSKIHCITAGAKFS